MDYSVKQLAKLAGVSVRTLHYYDEIGLLRPQRNPSNGYRAYDPPGLLRLQQILFLRELGLSLQKIQAYLDKPDFDLLTALKQHREALNERKAHLEQLVQTVEQTIQYLKGNIEMENKELFAGFTEEEEKRYTEEARQTYGDSKEFKESVKRWGSYNKDDKQRILKDGNAAYTEILAAMPFGPESPQAQAGIAHWEQNLRYFYEPSTEILLGLGDLYNENPDFSAFFKRMHPELAEFMRRAIQFYCKNR